jgi:hypothetical protein
MQDFRFLIFVTAHDPLSRFDVLLKPCVVMRAYPVRRMYLYISTMSMRRIKAVKDLLEPNVSF